MNEIKVIDKTQIMGHEIQVIEGGFGEGQKVILAKTVAEIHEVANVNDINKLINKNISRFGKNDLINLLNDQQSFREFAKENGLIGSNRTQDVFLLSERGYIKLVSMMSNDNDKKWQVMDALVEDYFNMRKELKENKNEKEELLLQLFSNDPLTIANAHKKLVEIETKPLLEKIEEDKPLVGFAETCIKSSDSILVRELAKLACDEGINIGQNKLYNKLRDWNYILKGNTEPTQYAMDRGYFEVIQRVSKTPYGEKVHRTTKVKPKGQIQIIERLKREVL